MSVSVRRRVKAITDTGFSMNVFGLGLVRLNFFAKLIHVHAHIMRFKAVAGPPCFLEELLVGHNLTGVPQQYQQQTILVRR